MLKQGDGAFPTTHWTLIKRLQSPDHAESHDALETICRQYHYPLYCYIRRRGLSHDDAQDSLHDFLAKLLRLKALQGADMTKGRLRTFLATSLQRFLINWHRDTHQRRHHEISDEETRYQQERFADPTTPEMALDRIWAATLIQASLEELSQAEQASKRAAQFQVLKPFLKASEVTAPQHQSAALQLGLTEAATRQAVKRLREKFRKLLRRRVAETLSAPTEEQIDEEMRTLRTALAS